MISNDVNVITPLDCSLPYCQNGIFEKTIEIVERSSDIKDDHWFAGYFIVVRVVKICLSHIIDIRSYIICCCGSIGTTQSR